MPRADIPNDAVIFESDGHMEGNANFTYDPDTSLLTVDNARVSSDIEIDGAINHDGTTVGFFGATPASQPAAYTITNRTEDRDIDCDGAVAVIGDGLGTLIEDLINLGILQGTVS